MNSSATNTGPSEGELFRKILGAEWQKLHPDIRARFARNPAPGKPLFSTLEGAPNGDPPRFDLCKLTMTLPEAVEEIA